MYRSTGLIGIPILGGATLILILMATVCTSAAVEPAHIAVSIPPQKWVVGYLAGDQVIIDVLLPPGSSPATFEPSPRQMAKLAHAIAYCAIGVPFERAVVPRIAELNPELVIVDTASGVEKRKMSSAGSHDHHSAYDPHVWLDPIRMKTISTTTARALQELLPSSHDVIEERLQKSIRALDAIDERISGVLAELAGREILVFHPAYGYFTDRYGLRQVAVEVEGKTPTSRQLASVIDHFGSSGVPAIFVQPQFSKASADRVAAALGSKVVELDPLAEDYISNLEEMARRIAAELGE
jgi:zinc transport system substrate-binding protein